MTLKKSVITIIVLFLLSFTQQEDRNLEGVIIWQEHRLLTRDDYKGRALKRSSISFAVGMYPDLKYEKESKQLVIKIYAIFDSKMSWINENSRDTEELIKHSQGHFDIVEIYARKMRRILQEARLKPDNAEKKISKLFYKIWKEAYEYQNLYDKETNYSKDKDKQEEWDRRIANKLKELEEYKNPVIVIK